MSGSHGKQLKMPVFDSVPYLSILLWHSLPPVPQDNDWHPSQAIPRGRTFQNMPTSNGGTQIPVVLER